MISSLENGFNYAHIHQKSHGSAHIYPWTLMQSITAQAETDITFLHSNGGKNSKGKLNHIFQFTSRQLHTPCRLVPQLELAPKTLILSSILALQQGQRTTPLSSCSLLQPTHRTWCAHWSRITHASSLQTTQPRRRLGFWAGCGGGRFDAAGGLWMGCCFGALAVLRLVMPGGLVDGTAG